MARKPLEQPKPRDPGGQPTKCTPTVRQAVVDAILKGAGREDAARAAKIAPSTLYLWLAEGRKQETGVYSEFLEAVEGAESELVRRAGEVLTDMLGPKTSESVRFAAAKLILERRRPDVWGSRAAVRVEGADGGPVEVKHSGQVEVAVEIPWERLGELTPEQLEALGRGVGE